MATDQENVNTRVSAILAELAAGDVSRPTYTDNGRTVNWTEYRASLLAELDSLMKLKAALGSYEVRTRMRG